MANDSTYTVRIPVQAPPTDRKISTEGKVDEEYGCPREHKFSSNVSTSKNNTWLPGSINLTWCICLGVLIMTCVILVASLGVPFLLNKVVIPTVDWGVRELSEPIQALLCLFSLAVFPTFLLPTTVPTMWLVGILFGYTKGVILILIGYTLGSSFPYFLGQRYVHNQVQVWLLNFPREAAILKLAGDGDWWYQFKVVFLLRLSPAPYTILNYAITATSIKYFPYILASVILIIPEAYFSVYVGKLMKSVADFNGRPLTPTEVATQSALLALGFLSIVIGVYYAKKALKEMEEKGQLPKRQSFQLIEGGIENENITKQGEVKQPQL